MSFLDSIRELNMASLIIRLLLAMCFGGIVGLERERHNRAAGMRTYMFVTIGAALCVLLSQYQYGMIWSVWADLPGKLGIGTDVSRYGAQVINGIGFLGAGSILVTGRQEVKGLTTAAGLWACACVGLAIGAGFYECVIVSFVLIFLAIKYLPLLENLVTRHSKHMNLYVEFVSLDDVSDIIGKLKDKSVKVHEVDINHKSGSVTRRPSAVFFLELKDMSVSHEDVVANVMTYEKVIVAEEL